MGLPSIRTPGDPILGHRNSVPIPHPSRVCLTRLKVGSVNHEESHEVRQEKGEPGGKDVRPDRGKQESDRPESDDARERDRPSPELPSKDPDPRAESDDRRESAQECVARRIDMGPQHRQENRDNPCRRRGHRRPSSAFLNRREDREDGGDDAREQDGPERARRKHPEGDRFGQGDETSKDQAEADEPSREPFLRRSQPSPIGTGWISLSRP